MLNRVWLAFFITALLAIAVQIFNGHIDVLSTSVEALFASAKLAAEISLGLIGVLSLWMGLMRVGEKAGVVGAIAFVFEPLLRRLMPEVPKGHPAFGSITMNLTANVFGLDNAATPLGLKAMHDLQSLNPQKKRGDQCANFIFSAQYFLCDLSACDGISLSCPTGGDGTCGYFFADFIGNIGIDTRRITYRGISAADFLV